MPDNKYISTSIENGSIFDTLVGNLLALRLEDWGWSEQDYDKISIEFSVASNDLFFLPIGNYRMLNFPISLLPNDLGITAIESVNLKVYVKDNSGTKYYILDVNNKSYLMSLSGSGLTPSWKDLENVGSDGEDMTLIHVGETAPENTNMIWIDTSKLITEDLITMKIYDTTSGTWKEYTITGAMDSSIYDPTGKKQDPFKYVMNAIEVIIGDYAEFIKHKNNELVLIHVTSEEKEYYNTVIISIDVINEMLQSGGDIYNSLIELITTNTAETVGTEEFTNQIEELKRLFNEHIGETHISESDVLSWNSKAPADHTHEYDPNVIINAEDISGDLSTLLGDTADAKERVKIVTSNAERLALTKPEIHNGCSVCVDDGINEPVWYKVIDDTKLNIEDGYKKFATTVTKTTFDMITNPPNTLEGYGITDGVSKDELKEIENKIDNEIENITFVPADYNKESVGESELYVGIQKTLGNGGGTSNYPMSFSKSLLDVLVYKDGNSNVDKFANTNIGELSSEISLGIPDSISGFSKFPSSNVKDDYFTTLYASDDQNPKFTSDGLGAMIKVDTSQNNIVYQNTYNIAEKDINILIGWDIIKGLYFKHDIVKGINSINSIYNILMNNGDPLNNWLNDKYSDLIRATGKIIWKETSNGLNRRDWISICYGNGKYVAISGPNTFAYSTDGITWTETSNGLNSRKWQTICYGNGKYVAVSYNSNTFAYSTDGITWTETSNGLDIRYWWSICYGNGKYVATSDINIFAYSTDGITWIETSNGLSSRGWYSICYGNGKYVAIANSSNTFTYSTDGIIWTETSNGLSERDWFSICYGNGKYVAISSNSKTFAYSTDGITWTETSNGLSIGDWHSICYGNGKYVAIASSINTFAYSTDGITWTETNNGLSDGYRNSICYGNGKYVAVSSDSNIFDYTL